MQNKIERIQKRDGRLVSFKREKIIIAILEALKATEDNGKELAENICDEAVDLLNERFSKERVPTVEDIQDAVEEALIKRALVKPAKAYILYREQHRKLREMIMAEDESAGRVDYYLHKLDWEVKENANMTYSLQGLNNYISSHLVKRYWLEKIYPKEIRSAVRRGDFHIHDLQTLGNYCCGWDLYDFLKRGFGGVSGKIRSGPPKHLKTALGQVVNFLYTVQGEVAGAVAFSNFDTLVAPFIRYDRLSYSQVKQAMQEFLFNMNVPCYDDKTEVLTKSGFKLFKNIDKNDKIATLRDGRHIEYQKPAHIVKYPYTGNMIHIKTTRLDLMVTPNHKMLVLRETGKGRKLKKVRADELKYNDWIPKVGEWKGKDKAEFVLPALTQKEMFYSPFTENRHEKTRKWEEKKIEMDNWLAFLGIYLAEGYAVREDSSNAKNGNYVVGVVNLKRKKEVRKILDNLPFKYREDKDRFIILNKQLWKYLRKLGNCYTKYIPEEFKNLPPGRLRIILDAFNIGDGSVQGKRKWYYSSSKRLQDDIGELILKVGHSPRYFKREERELFIDGRVLHPDPEHPNLKIVENRSNYYTFIPDKYRKRDGRGYANFKRIPYKGFVYCVEIPNHVVFVRRNGTCVWSGNTRVGFQTPFSNLTLDITPSPIFEKQPVIIGGEAQEEEYRDFQHEMDMLNKAFYEVMLEGDAQSRVFTFPIPTINITKDFPWDKEALEPMWEATARYGINYFGNYINSDMDPKDVRSMCCRLRLRKDELYNRGGGGLFGAGSLTGSIGVVTINMPRIGYLSKGEKEFFERLEKLMHLAKESLEIKRKIVEGFTEEGLYPYCKYWLASIKKMRSSYWDNHFSTIGLIGMNEAVLNFIGRDIGSSRGRKFASKIMDFMRKKLIEYQEETGNLYNLEATPAEGTSYRLALKDKGEYPDIITAGTEEAPYYTNSTQLPVNYTDDVFEALRLQDDLQCKYTGGSVTHLFLGERVDDSDQAKRLVRKVFEKFNLPYISLTPTFSVCPIHGYLAGEHFECPKCTIKQPCEVYSRIVGYLRPLNQWNEGKRQEFSERKEYKVK